MRELKTYRKKRDFSKSKEPRGSDVTLAKGKILNNKTHFVVQLHNARQLHFDFRLFIGGVLVSWAIPKGPSTNPEDKRLAIRTEDHPEEYGNFEGNIPIGNYGSLS